MKQKRIRKTLLMWKVNDENISDECTVCWLRKNDKDLRRLFPLYPNVIDGLSHSLFTLSCIRGKLTTMKFLLEQGANLNHVQSQTGDDALSAALYYNQYVAAAFLREQGMKLQVAITLEANPNRESTLAVKAVERYITFLRESQGVVLNDGD